ncbi:GNAT family N-acetyltransferase [Pseudahrensia aquimaris]|uniref:L-ornithine N(alpha)-acyltransferase n=1 Tax=Pseudahrensia aquimaris TaxID=744461 RepID=A0ABW3FFQ3_9HYPH
MQTAQSTKSKPQAPASQGYEPHRIIGRLGALDVRLAVSPEEVEAAQKLRYQVFFEDMGAKPSETAQASGLDQDAFDDHCEHLLVIDREAEYNHGIVGTYRLLDSSKMCASLGFYSQNEFDLTPLLSARPGQRFLELGRSCIAESHRSRRTMELAWHGVWSLVVERKIDVMFGCASFNGTDPQSHAECFSLLGETALIDPQQDCPPRHAAAFALQQSTSSGSIDRRAFAKLPPLLKGYLRLGAKVASHAVIDRQFGTTDVLIVLDVAKISQKYIDHYGAQASRFAVPVEQALKR